MSAVGDGRIRCRVVVTSDMPLHGALAALPADARAAAVVVLANAALARPGPAGVIGPAEDAGSVAGPPADLTAAVSRLAETVALLAAALPGPVRAPAAPTGQDTGEPERAGPAEDPRVATLHAYFDDNARP